MRAHLIRLRQGPIYIYHRQLQFDCDIVRTQPSWKSNTRSCVQTHFQKRRRHHRLILSTRFDENTRHQVDCTWPSFLLQAPTLCFRVCNSWHLQTHCIPARTSGRCVALNEKGQLSIIAFLLVATILVATVVVTYSIIRSSLIQEQPPIQSATDETNFAIKRILSITSSKILSVDFKFIQVK